MAVTCTATAPEPDTPRATARIIASEVAVRPTAPPAVTVEFSIAALTVLAMTLADRATPTATAPEPDTPKAKESILELSDAARETSPSASTVDSTMDASVVLVITLAARLTWTDTAPVAATPPAKLKMAASCEAISPMAPPLSTVASSIPAVT